eukprot:GHVL01032683.1.p1 GENE.GHVL01032683.1~~GHVL01032683.1.p1  ORF type:complete len:731 (+),score=118.51 GHVL01032683.1:30-2222(+)
MYKLITLLICTFTAQALAGYRRVPSTEVVSKFCYCEKTSENVDDISVFLTEEACRKASKKKRLCKRYPLYFDRDYTIGSYEGNVWKQNCLCSPVTWQTEFNTASSCEDDWFEKENCSLQSEQAIFTKPSDQFWSRSSKSGGLYVNGKWKSKCGCKKVDWPTPFKSEEECIEGWRGDIKTACYQEQDSLLPVADTDSLPIVFWRKSAEKTNISQNWIKGLFPLCKCEISKIPTAHKTKRACEQNWLSQGTCAKENLTPVADALPINTNITVQHMPSVPLEPKLVFNWTRDTMRGGRMHHGAWYSKCSCKAVPWETDFTTLQDCVDDWKNDKNKPCYYKKNSIDYSTDNETARLIDNYRRIFKTVKRQNDNITNQGEYGTDQILADGQKGSESIVEGDQKTINGSAVNGKDNLAVEHEAVQGDELNGKNGLQEDEFVNRPVKNGDAQGDAVEGDEVQGDVFIDGKMQGDAVVGHEVQGDAVEGVQNNKEEVGDVVSEEEGHHQIVLTPSTYSSKYHSETSPAAFWRRVSQGSAVSEKNGEMVEGTWFSFCDCQQTSYPSKFLSRQSCILDWLEDNNHPCLATEQTLASPANFLPKQNGQDPVFWARNWSLVGQLEGPAWHVDCHCSPVNWDTGFYSERSCIEDWRAHQDPCIMDQSGSEGPLIPASKLQILFERSEPRLIYWTKSWGRGTSVVNGKTLPNCECVQTKNPTGFTSSDSCVSDWLKDEECAIQL